MDRLLTDEELGEAIKSIPWAGNDNQYVFRNISYTQDIKTKRVILEWLEEHNQGDPRFVVASKGISFSGSILISFEDWQTLKEDK